MNFRVKTAELQSIEDTFLGRVCNSIVLRLNHCCPRVLQEPLFFYILSPSRPSLRRPHTRIMRFGRAAAYAAFAGWIGAGLAHNIALKAHTRECFHEELHKDDKMTVTFQVGDREFGGAGNLEIDFYVSWRFLVRFKAEGTDHA